MYIPLLLSCMSVACTMRWGTISEAYLTVKRIGNFFSHNLLIIVIRKILKYTAFIHIPLMYKCVKLRYTV